MEDHNYVFISHSSKNKDVANRIVELLEKNDISCYIAPRDISPGSIFAEEIVYAIAHCLCCLLLFSKDANSSGFVLKEINSAVNHNAPIIPVKIDETVPCESIDFYLGTNHWINCPATAENIDVIIQTIIRIRNKTRQEKNSTEQETKKIMYTKPVVLDYMQLEEIGYDAQRRVMETIEIDYLSLEEESNDYVINEEIEGKTEDWMDYASSYPETASFLVCNDKVVGYSQIELIEEEDYQKVISGKQIITGDMQQLYSFGGEFFCYIVIMPIINKYRTGNNYSLLVDDLFEKFVRFAEQDIHITRFGISVYSPLLEQIVKAFGFAYKGKNIANGKIYELTPEDIKNSKLIARRYAKFRALYVE